MSGLVHGDLSPGTKLMYGTFSSAIYQAAEVCFVYPFAIGVFGRDRGFLTDSWTPDMGRPTS